MSIQLTKQDDELLQNIDLNKAGNIVENFEIFFDFLQSDLPASEKLKSITGNKLVQLNSVMSDPISVDLQRPSQASYPNINGLYVLALSSGLVKRHLKGKKWHLVQNQTLYTEWDRLSCEQKYLNLLVTWVSCSPSIVDECDVSSATLRFIDNCLKHLTPQDWFEPEKIRLDFSSYSGLFNLALAEMFGFVELKLDSSQAKWVVSYIKLTDLGMAFSHLLYREFALSEADCTDDFNYFSSIKEVPTDIFEYALVPYFPHWSYLSPFPQPKAAGRYTFRLTIEHFTARATFSISHYATLHDLALFVLQELVDFELDHLYRFHYQDARYHNKMVYHPELYDDNEDCKHSDELSLQDINFEVGQIFTLVYDLGEQWRFHLLVVDFTEGDENEPPEIIETKGEPPRQYRYYEDGKDQEEDEEDDYDLE